jgi:hypothetical protein
MTSFRFKAVPIQRRVLPASYAVALRDPTPLRTMVIEAGAAFGGQPVL